MSCGPAGAECAPGPAPVYEHSYVPRTVDPSERAQPFASAIALIFTLAVPFLPPPSRPLTPPPLPRTAACPRGFSSSGGECTPGSSARFAVPRNDGPRQSGYASSGDYRLASSDASKLAVAQTGS